ncbi:hypothetical protein RDI58_005004 [Solanum bulbocastanum]|uniref:Uncharacterized protein n=1 Tax=Solanum bulbocastanum TaxID=147425 RepID=A0AAN8U7L6_SOLBU
MKMKMGLSHFCRTFKRNQVFFVNVYAADNGEDHAGENKIGEKPEGGGCEANEERQTLVCFLNSVRMPLLVIRNGEFGISCLVVTFNNSLMQLLIITAIPPRSEGSQG